LLELSRNFGSFSAIAAGLAAGKGDYFAVIAADLQEPPELVLRFAGVLSRGEADVVFGVRAGRADPWLSHISATLFWGLYRRFVVPEMPAGGVDVFGCTRAVRDNVIGLREANTNLIALLLWVGFRRQYITYERQARREGKSAWTLRKKLRYSLDSIFNFTDLPLRLLMYGGVLGMSFAVIFGIVLIIARLTGRIPVLGYTPIVLTIMFFGGLTSAAFGIVGQYLWLTLQNARQRPPFIVASTRVYGSEPR
jgi:glycosyltransferase involved in cell wall biosynthesis